MRYVSQVEQSLYDLPVGMPEDVLAKRVKEKVLHGIMYELNNSIEPKKELRDGHIERHTVELQIFDYEEWLKFKLRLKGALEASRFINSPTLDLILIGKMFTEFEGQALNKQP